MIEILKIEEGRVDFITKKNLNKVTIKVKSGYSSEIFYSSYFEEFTEGVIYWIGHPIFYIEEKVIFEIHEDDKIYMSLQVGEGQFTKNPKHLKNQLNDLEIDDDLISRYNGTYWEIFVEESFAVNKNLPEVYINVKNFIDLGGNCGFFSRMIFNKNPNAKGVIVEPNSQLEDVIRKTNSKFNYRLKINSFSDQRGKFVNFKFAEKYNHTAVSHESDIDIGFEPNPNYKFYTETVETIDMVSLMNEFEKDEIIDILKVDIEGGEQHLNGVINQELIKKHVKYVLVETHSNKIKEDILKNFTDVFYVHSENPTSENFNHLILVNKKIMNKNKKILVKVPCPAMGDSLCATPTIKKIYESYGHKIDVMAVRTDVFENNPYIENLLKYENEVSGYDEIFDTYVRRIKVNTNMDQNNFYEDSIEIKLSNFECRQIHALSVGITLYPDELSCEFYPNEQTEKSKLIDKDYITLHVTESWPTRTWTVKKWQRLINLIKEHTNLKIATIGVSHSEQGYFGTINKKIIKLNNVDYDFCIDNEMKDQSTIISEQSLSEMWHILNNSFGIISFDSGPIHLAGTTDSWIFQIGSSIRPEKTAPWRNGTQNYKFEFIGGECKIFCASCPKYSVKEWGTINSMPYYPECQEKFKEFKCQPSPDEVFFRFLETYRKNV